jgi:glycosyltransferase involved in cell wall biosynthesis
MPSTEIEPPSVSCIIPVFNGASFLAEAVDSVLGQTQPPFEVIIVDDGSTDDTPGIAERLASHIRYLRQDNAGAPAARNTGISSARGELIAFLDADDLWHPQKLAHQVPRFMARPELDVSLTHIRNFWVPGLEDEALRYRDHPLSKDQPGHVTMAMVVRRQVFDRIGRFDEAARHRDALGWLMTAARHKLTMETLPDVLAFRRIHHSNLSRRRGDEYRVELLTLAKSLLDQRRSRPPST